MAGEIVFPSATGSGPIAGWRLVSDSVVDETGYRRRAVYMGVRTSNDAAAAAVKAAYGQNLLEMAVDAPDGSCVGRVTALYSTDIGTSGSGNDDPVSPDTYQLEPIVIPVVLAAHPAFASVAGAVLAIDDALAHGQADLAAASAVAGGDAARHYYALRLAGVTQWDAVGYIWRVTRHYSTRASTAAVLAAAIASANTVVQWSGVEGYDKIPEPRYTYALANGGMGGPASFEWRVGGPQVTRTADALDITYTYQGAWSWSSYLYSGGSWAPAAPT